MVHVKYVCDTVCQQQLQERRKGKEIERSLYESMYLFSSRSKTLQTTLTLAFIIASR